MNGRERIRVAMELGEPDRVPVFCQLSIGHYFVNTSATPFDIWFRSKVFAEALVELQIRYGFDGILVNLPGRDPAFEHHIERLAVGDDGGTTVHWRNGCYTQLPQDDNPHYYQNDGTRHFPSFDAIDPAALYYVEPWDLTEVTYPYTWGFDTEPAQSSDDFFPSYHLDPLEHVRALVGQEVSVHAEVFSPFSQFLELLGYEAALMALLDDPAKVHACLEQLCRGTIDLADKQLAAGADAILISSAFAGSGLISRQHYSDFVLPYERKLIEAVKAKTPAAVLYTHTCGGIGDRLDLMLMTGTDGIDTLDPPPLGTVDLADAVRTLSGRAFIKGNLDAVNTLLHGDSAMLTRAVNERLRVAKPGGGFIMSTACSVAPHVLPERLEQLSALVRAEGRYS